MPRAKAVPKEKPKPPQPPAAFDVIVGCDLALRKTGIVLKRRIGLDVVLEHGLFETTSKDLAPGALLAMVDALVEFVAPGQLEHILLVAERPSARHMNDRINDVLHWAFRGELAEDCDLWTLDPYPPTLKKFVTGDGKAGDIGATVMKRWGQELKGTTQEDIVEALALVKFGECWLEHREDGLGPHTSWTGYQADAVVTEGTGLKRRPRLAAWDTGSMGVAVKRSECNANTTGQERAA